MRTKVLRTCAALTLAIAGARAAWAEAVPVFSDTGPDAVAYGATRGYPKGGRTAQLPQVNLVGGYSDYDTKYPHNVVARSNTPSQLHRAPEELRLTYRYQNVERSLADYLNRNPTTGLLIARDDTILFEHYQYARTDKNRMLSHSMAKTITAMLVGIAVSEGKIRSIDQPAADYVPGLAGTEYGRTSIRDLLHMASGVAFFEVYDGTDDLAKLGTMLFGRGDPGPVRAVSIFNTREAPAGTRFHYASIETEVLGLVLAHAVGQSPAAYLQSHVWQPMGAEADATWVVDASGQEVTYCCFSAVLRDWARFALLLAHDGVGNGQQIIPRQWLSAATTVQAPFLAPGTATPFDGYGYQTWLLGNPRHQFALRGIHGQAILIDPGSHLVLVHTAVRLKAAGDPAAAELMAVWRALVARYSG